MADSQTPQPKQKSSIVPSFTIQLYSWAISGRLLRNLSVITTFDTLLGYQNVFCTSIFWWAGKSILRCF